MSTAETVESEEPEDGTWDAIRKLPPSAKLVAKVLENEDTLTQSELAEETLLSPRTVRYAVSRLEEVDAVESQFSFSDARKRLYSLDVEGTTPSH
jgi:DNA-binding MarR family transcriptional regulator